MDYSNYLRAGFRLFGWVLVELEHNSSELSCHVRVLFQILLESARVGLGAETSLRPHLFLRLNVYHLYLYVLITYYLNKELTFKL